MERAVRLKSCIALLFFVASCTSVRQGPAKKSEPTRRPPPPPDTSEQLTESIVQFSTSVVEEFGNGTAEPPVSNSYSHQRLLGRRRRLGEPRVQLRPTKTYSAMASTDCSGWLSFVLNTVSPLHEAVLQSQRRLDQHNRAYSDDFALREGRRPWARAFVVTQFLRSEYASETGFEPVANFEDLQPGDIVAWAMGRYAKPSDEDRPTPRDTGHVFVVVGTPTTVDPETKDYDGRGTLSEEAAKVIAVPVVDSSSIVHFDPDSRKDDKGRYSLSTTPPHHRAKPGGVGTGTVWLALSDSGRVLERRLGPRQKYRPVLARAARLRGGITLDEHVLDEGGSLLVRVYDSAPSEYGGVPFGEVPIHLSGKGAVRLAGGRLVLKGQNDFTGGVTVEDAELIVASSMALGTGDVAVRGGSVTLREPAIASSATLSLANDLPDGSFRLDFKGRNVVRAIQIGGAMYRCGTWGGPDSDAMFVHPVFAGSGVLKLTAQPSEACTPATEPSSRRRSRRESKLDRADG